MPHVTVQNIYKSKKLKKKITDTATTESLAWQTKKNRSCNAKRVDSNRGPNQVLSRPSHGPDSSDPSDSNRNSAHQRFPSVQHHSVSKQLHGPFLERGRPNNDGGLVLLGFRRGASHGSESRVDLGPSRGWWDPLDDKRVGPERGERAVDVVGGGGELVGEDSWESVLSHGEAVGVGWIASWVELGRVGQWGTNSLRSWYAHLSLSLSLWVWCGSNRE